MIWGWLDQRPIIVALAGPNGAGKSTFYQVHIAPAGLSFVNADLLARQLDIDPYTAASVAERLLTELVKQGESFCFETVFSDPVGAKLQFLQGAVATGYLVVLCYIGIADANMSEQRVAMRVTQGGHDVPTEKLHARFPRTLANLKQALVVLPHVIVFDNSQLSHPFRCVATFENGQATQLADYRPDWLQSIM